MYATAGFVSSAAASVLSTPAARRAGRLCGSTAVLTPRYVAPALRPSYMHQIRVIPRAAAEPAAGQDVKGAAEMRMQKTIDATAVSFNTVRTGRASASILDRVTVEYYGADTALNTLASISVQGSSTILISPFDKSIIKDVERALMESDLGMAPSNDGSVIRLNVPPLTQERRKELAKQVKGLAEEGRVAIRNIRRDAVDKCKKIEKDGDIGKDESKDLQDAVQKSTDKYIKKIDEMLKGKEKDIMTV